MAVHDTSFDTLVALESGHVPEQRFGKYEVLQRIGSGGMGVVFLARDTVLNRTVALKVLRSDAGDERFQREALALARLTHSNIVQIYDVGTEGPIRYLTMQYVKGTPLDVCLTEKRFSREQLLGIMVKIARAVHAAHEHGIIHRDLKPSNIIIDERGEPFVTDFGLAKLKDSQTHLTRSGTVVGTLLYMSPEVARGGAARVEVTSDVYSLGVMLYEMIAGAPPFDGSSDAEIYNQVLNNDLVPLRRKTPGVPVALEAICARATDRDPARRYPTAAEFADDLERFLKGEPVRARPPSVAGRAIRVLWRRRSVRVSLLAVGVAVSALMFWRGDSKPGAEPDKPPPAPKYREVRFLEGHTSEADCVAFSPDGCLVASGGYDGRVIVWDVRTGQKLATLAGDLSVNAVAFSPDGRLLAAGCWSGEIKIWELPAFRETPPLRHHRSSVFSVAFRRDGKFLASGGDDRTIVVWDLAVGEVEEVLPAGDLVDCVAYSFDGKLLAACGKDRGVTVWDTETWRIRHRLEGHTDHVSSVSFSPDGSLLASAGYDRTIRVWQTGSGKAVRDIAGHRGQIWSMTFLNAQQLVSGGTDGTVRVWDLATGKQEYLIDTVFSRVTHVSCFGTKIAASGDRGVQIWELRQAD